MCRFLVIILGCYFFILSHGYSAALSEENQWAHQRASLLPHPDIHFGRLENGFSYAWHQAKPSVELHERIGCQIYLYVNVGSWQEEEDELGMAHFVEHMAFKGGHRFPKDSMVRTFQAEGLSFGADQNAHTGPSETVYQFNVKRCTEDKVRIVFEALRDIADGLTIDESDVDKEKAVIDAEERYRASDSLASEYLRIDDRINPIGKKSIRNNFTADKVRAFYEKWYIPQNMKLLVVGDIENLDGFITPFIPSIFASLKKGNELPRRPLIGEVVRSTKITPDPNNPFVQASMGTVKARSITHRSIDEMIEHEKRIIIADILYNRMNIFNQGNNSVTVSLVDQSFYTSDSQREFWETTRAPVLGLSCMAMLSDQSVASVFAYWQHIIDDILANGFSDDEFSSVIAQKLVALSDFHLNSGSTMTVLLNDARGFVPLLTEEQKRDLIVPAMHNFSKEEAVQLLRDLCQGSLAITLLGKTPYQNEESLMTDIKAAQSVGKVHNDKESKHTAYAYRSSDSKAEILEQTCIHGQTTVSFSNGVKLIYKHDALRTDDFQITVKSNGAHPSFNRKNSILVDEGLFPFKDVVGTFKHAPEDLRKMFGDEYHNFWVSHGPEELSLISLGRAQKKRDVLQQLELLSGYFIEPKVSEQKFFEIIRRQFSRQENTPQAKFHSFMMEVFGDNADYNLVSPGVEELATLNPSDLFGFYKSFLSESELVIFYIGADEADVVMDAVARTFGTIKPRMAVNQALLAKSELPTANFQSRVIKKISAPDQSKQFLMMLFPIPSYAETPADAASAKALDVLANILEERLFILVRKSLGATYGVNVKLIKGRAYRTYQALQLFLDIDPERSELLIEHILTLTDEVAQREITDEEFVRACAQTNLLNVEITKDAVISLAKEILRRDLVAYAW